MGELCYSLTTHYLTWLFLDHHCPWLGSCIVSQTILFMVWKSDCLSWNKGHRTYLAFLHFLFSITLLALYLAVVSISALVYAFNNPYGIVSFVQAVYTHCR